MQSLWLQSIAAPTNSDRADVHAALPAFNRFAFGQVTVPKRGAHRLPTRLATPEIEQSMSSGVETVAFDHRRRFNPSGSEIGKSAF
jgi:hypothetical protein